MTIREKLHQAVRNGNRSLRRGKRGWRRFRYWSNQTSKYFFKLRFP